jgi:hypothetical protein
MSEQNTGDSASAAVPLRDGGELRVDAEGVSVRETRYRLEQIQDARQVSPDPETIGLRVQGIGLVSIVPARAGDAGVALDALYRLRPDLRPAGWVPLQSAGMPEESPMGQPNPIAGQGQPGSLPPASFGPPPGYPPPPYAAPPPYGYPPPPSYWPPAYGPSPGYTPPPWYPSGPYAGPPLFPGYAIVPGTKVRRGGLGPWPQSIGDVLGTIFRLYFENFWRFLLLGLALAALPSLLAGLLVVGELAFFGLDPRQGLFQILANLEKSLPGPGQTPSGVPITPFNPPTLTPELVALIAVGGFVYVIVALVLSAWQAAAFGIAARESVAGRPVRIGAAIGEGLRRLLSALGALLLLLAIFVGLAVALGIILTALEVGLVLVFASSNGSANATLALLTLLTAPLGELLIYVIVIYFAVRLGMAPYIAGADHLSPGAAIGRSWSVTRGNWWRTFVPLLVIYLVVYLVSSFIVTPLMFVSLGAMALVGIPLETVLTGPLLALALIVMYYDLRLRLEGFVPLAAQLDLEGFAPPATGTGEAGAPGSGAAAQDMSPPPVGPAPLEDQPPAG